MQTGELHRPHVTEAQLRTSASCDKGGSLVRDLGPGNDWRCVVSWHLPGTTITGSAIYQLDVNPDGRYVAAMLHLRSDHFIMVNLDLAGPRDQQFFHRCQAIHAHRAGTVQSLSIEPGQPVTTGQVICTIETD